MKKKRSIVIDCDPGWDDAVALAICFAKLRSDLKGITVVFGNKSVDETLRFAQKMAVLCEGNHIPVAKGASLPLYVPPFDVPWVHLPQPALGDIDKQYHSTSNEGAGDFLARTLRENEDCLTLLALGPLTNVASLLISEPTLKSKIDEIIILGGSIRKGNVTKNAEFNFFMDALAANIVLRSGIKTTIIPMDVAKTVTLHSSRLELLNLCSSVVVKRIKEMISQYRSINHMSEGAPIAIYDAVAACYLISSPLFRKAQYACCVELERGEVFGKLSISYDLSNVESTSVVTNIDADAVANVIIDALCSWG